jgi:hypothetical protein
VLLRLPTVSSLLIILQGYLGLSFQTVSRYDFYSGSELKNFPVPFSLHEIIFTRSVQTQPCNLFKKSRRSVSAYVLHLAATDMGTFDTSLLLRIFALVDFGTLETFVPTCLLCSTFCSGALNPHHILHAQPSQQTYLHLLLFTITVFSLLIALV